MTQTHLPPPPEADSRWAWFLDVDGTIVDIAPTPSAIDLPEGLPALLENLARRHDGALALVSGRTLDNLALLMIPFRPAMAGLHGMECRDGAGNVTRAQMPDGLDDIRARLLDFGKAHQGLLLEDKGMGVALHYRQAPELEQACREAARQAIAGHPGFQIMEGKMVFEVKAAGIHKGKAVETFMAQPPFAGRIPVFVGDDVTDEDGFAAANALGGLSVLVGPLRETLARYHLPDIPAALDWLAKCAGQVWAPQMGSGAD